MAIPSFEPVTLAIQGESSRFPVRRVFCVGRNYAEHAREMGHDPDREPPFFFGKDAEALSQESTLPYPSLTEDVHHEVELVVALAAGGRDLKAEDVRSAIYGYAVGIDYTRRDMQSVAKKLARPWFLSKSFIGAAPITPLIPAATLGHPREGRIWLEVEGAVRQDGNLNQMIWGIEETVAILSTYDELLPGDLVFTGTPAGVGPVARGQAVRAGVDGVATLEMRFT
ncbi:fumarylacetoacetate hydrolase family protein [Marinivivus vitaminiproducens]|uniref:fumarylacetoacetate hydrolase family protein n=1 Tax=Marinivivus vitaminiproducens TaxID=3035935 RepID=UPI00279888D3|nr:fumarylacetoacetate hydrolase family protein [Geminicoccaceae bacterium SCSIO 64248]